MRIIKHGTPPSKKKKFVCHNCGCEFEADYGEYYPVSGIYRGEGSFYNVVGECGCPDCGETVRDTVVVHR